MEHSNLQQASPLWELVCQIGSHSVTCHPQRWRSDLYYSQFKLVLNLATQEGCKA